MMTWLKRLFAAIWAALTHPAPPPVNPGGGSSPPDAPDNPSDAGGGAGYTVVRGQRVEQEMSVPFTLSFSVTGVERFSGRDMIPNGTNNPDTAMLAWAYHPVWGNGKMPFVSHLRTYKIIGNDGTVREGAALPESEWFASHTYDVTYYVTAAETGATILDRVTGQRWESKVPFAAPAKMVVGYGWPPSTRPGVAGAVLTGIVLEESASPALPDAGTGITWDESAGNVGLWPITAALHGVRWVKDGVMCGSITGVDHWPEIPGYNPKHTVGSWWLVAKFEGVWRAATMEWYGRGKLSFRGKKWNGHDDTHGPLTHWKPTPGATIGVMISTPARAGVQTITERSAIVWLVLP